MRNLLLGVIGIVVLGAAGVTVAAAMQPDSIEVERSTMVNAIPGDIYPYTNDLKLFVQWSPWTERDPEATNEFSDPSFGTDAWYTWDGNDEVGAGKMTILESVADERVVYEMAFLRPMEGTAGATFQFLAEGDQTKVVWSFEQTGLAMTDKLFGLFVSFDDLIGADYEQGLSNLAPLVEAAAQARVEAAARAAEEAAAAEEAEAAEGEEDGPA